jgi:hypothetical protein
MKEYNPNSSNLRFSRTDPRRGAPTVSGAEQRRA